MYRICIMVVALFVPTLLLSTAKAQQIILDPQANGVPAPGIGGLGINAIVPSEIMRTFVVDGVHYTTVAAAMAGLQSVSPQGGDVWIPCGKYVGPPASSFFTGVHLRSSCSGIPASAQSLFQGLPYIASNATTLTYTTGLTISRVGNIALDNLTFQFTGSNGSGNLVFNAVTGSRTDNLAVLCADTASNCLTVQGDSTANSVYSSSENHFLGDTVTVGGHYGIWLTGYFYSSTVQTFSTENFFQHAIVFSPTRGAVMFNAYCDSNQFQRLDLFSNHADVDGVTFNSSLETNQGVYWEVVDFYDETFYTSSPRSIGHYSLIFNPNGGEGNYVMTGSLSPNAAGTLPANYALVNDGGNHIWQDLFQAQTAGGASVGSLNVIATNYYGSNGTAKFWGHDIFNQTNRAIPAIVLAPVDDISSHPLLQCVNAGRTAVNCQLDNQGNARFFNLDNTPIGTATRSTGEFTSGSFSGILNSGVPLTIGGRAGGLIVGNNDQHGAVPTELENTGSVKMTWNYQGGPGENDFFFNGGAGTGEGAAFYGLSNAGRVAHIADFFATGVNIVVPLSAGGVAAVSCTAGSVNLQTLTVTNGIVTHC